MSVMTTPKITPTSMIPAPATIDQKTITGER